jgi:hypothetical protein
VLEGNKMILPNYTPPFGIPQSTPPFIGSGMVAPMPPADQPVGVCQELPGPFCFGLDTLICQSLPKTIHLGGAPSSLMERVVGGVDIPVQLSCCAVLNAICGLTIFVALTAILSIALVGLLR